MIRYVTNPAKVFHGVRHLGLPSQGQYLKDARLYQAKLPDRDAARLRASTFANHQCSPRPCECKVRRRGRFTAQARKPKPKPKPRSQNGNVSSVIEIKHRGDRVFQEQLTGSGGEEGEPPPPAHRPWALGWRYCMPTDHYWRRNGPYARALLDAHLHPFDRCSGHPRKAVWCRGVQAAAGPGNR